MKRKRKEPWEIAALLVSLAVDLMILGGAALITFGAWGLCRSAGWIIGGSWLIFFGYVLIKNSGGGGSD